MFTNNNLIKNNNRKIKHFKTESNLKTKGYTMVSPLYKKFNYKLFNLNEKFKLLNNNNIKHYNIRDLLTNIKVKNYNNNSIKNINITSSNSKHNYLNNKFAKTVNNLNSQFNRNKINLKINHKYISKNKNNYSKIVDLFSKKKFTNKIDNKLKLRLIPLYYLNNNNKKNKLKNRKKNLSNNLYKYKGELYKTNNDNEILSKTYYTNNKELLKKSNNLFEIRMKANTIESKTEENDMKPKIRFINLKKDLLEENLKINKMFADFNREIIEKEKSLKFIGKHIFKYN